MFNFPISRLLTFCYFHKVCSWFGTGSSPPYHKRNRIENFMLLLGVFAISLMFTPNHKQNEVVGGLENDRS